MQNRIKERAVTRIQALADTIKNLSFAEMNGQHVTISIGIAFAPEHGTCYMDLYKNADTALYEQSRTAEMDIFFSKSRIVLYNDDISQECRHNIIYTKHIMHE